MSVCSWPDRRLAALLALAVFAFAAPASAARTARSRPFVEVHTSQDSTTGDHVVIGPDGIEVRESQGGTSVEIGRGHRVSVDHSGDAMVRLFSDARIAAGERVEGDVVAVFGSVAVDGEVDGSVVAVFGGVKLGGAARVEQDVVSVGGGIDADPGARIGGESTSVGFLPVTFGLPALSILFGMTALGWLVTLLFGWLFELLFPAQLRRISETAGRRAVASFGMGLLSGPAAIIGFFLLLVTVVGIPVAFLGLFAYPVLVYVGQIVGLRVLGARLARDPAGEHPIRALVLGSTFVAFFFLLAPVLWQSGGGVRSVAVFLSLFGVLALFVLSMLGTGAILLSRFGQARRERTQPAPDPAPAAGPAPTPAA